MNPGKCIVIGGGQTGLAVGYYLRRAGVDFTILDANNHPGGAWQHAWDSLRLFSPAAASNLPGWQMPAYTADGGFPTAAHVIDYLTRYEQRLSLPVHRPVRVTSVDYDDGFRLESSAGVMSAQAVIAATGTWDAPFVPHYPGRFAGRQLHTVHYRTPAEFAGQKVAVVGAGNSGAQIAADLALAGIDTQWLTQSPPAWMPDDVDGSVLFHRARATILGLPGENAQANHGNIVMVPPVLRARDAGLLDASPMPARLDDIDADVIIWATGFRPALRCLRGLVRRDSGRGGLGRAGSGRAGGCGWSPTVPGLWLMGYGNFTGAASATLSGVGMHAKSVVAEVADFLG